MSLNDVRRHQWSSARPKPEAERSGRPPVSPTHGAAVPSTEDATLTQPGAASASASKRAVAAASVGVNDPDEATFPSGSRKNSSRVSAEWRLSNEPAHQTTAWCLARVSAT